MSRSISVIGGGASAVLFLAHFAREKAPPCAITVYERSGKYARGIAYGTTQAAHLLNVRAKDMSAYADDPAHFAAWLDGRLGPDDFAPRMVYGDYLEDVLREGAASLSAAGHKVSFRTEDVIVLPRADITVLAAGNARPATLRGGAYLSARDGYHDNPFSVAYTDLDVNTVFIAGTGLSMVDAVLSLDAAGYRGKIIAVSRHGLLPQVHAAPDIPAFSLPDTAQLPRTALGLLRFARARIRDAAQKSIPWHSVINSFRPVTNAIWLEMDAQEQRKFARLVPFWNIHRHRMAPQVAAVIARWRESGRLEIRKDRIESVARGLAVECRTQTVQADCVINCLGYKPPAETPDEKRVFGIGPVMAGKLFETTAIPEIRAGAQDAARKICARFAEI